MEFKSQLKSQRNDKSFWIIMLVSFVMRLIYAVRMKFDCAPHDLFYMTNDGTIGHGHLGYIEYFYNFRQLPDFDPTSHWSFYNPPLHHIISAVFYGINRSFGLDSEGALELLQVMPVLVCTVSIFVVYLIIKEFNLDSNLSKAFTVLAAFYPPLFWMSASLTSDPLSLMFMLLGVLFTIRWYKNQSFTNIIGIALSIGLGMMTKLNVAYIAFGTAFIFLWILIGAIRSKGNVATLIKQYVVFCVICVPLGLWWPIRCKVLFDMPFNYIQRLPEGCMDLTGYTLWQRFGFPSFEQLQTSFVSINEDLDCNLWWTLIKSFLFDEDTSMRPFTVPLAMLNDITLKVALVVLFVMTGLTLYFFIKKSSRADRVTKIYLTLLVVPVMASYIVFNINYPFICTISSRYIAVLYIVPLIASGCALSEIKSEKFSKYFAVGAYAMSGLLACLFVLFCFSSNAFV